MLAVLAGRFDRLMIQPASLFVLVAGLLTAWELDWPGMSLLGSGNSNWLLASMVLFVSIGPLVPLVFLPLGRLFEAALRGASRPNCAPRWTTASSRPRTPTRPRL
jgi:hypothetical protein